ncbi:hypothetical protein L0665_07725 [Methanogenium marinum]|uniref:Uncharacterized protein n=1 Tax=Methanogenium marinum TaxID=348610 RepID=A0A9Q4KQ47_9EURY|nr:hypothetical protein [Methanogenium marinum]MDE4908493.1 hypothetical protein [Methanogenium marinum]
MTIMNRRRDAGFAGIGICIIILFTIFAPVVLAIIAGCIIGAFLVYAILLTTPAAYSDEEQEITEDEILFVYDDI